MYRFVLLSDGLRGAQLDAARLDVKSVTVDGHSVPFRSAAEKLYLDFGRPYAKEASLKL